MAQLKDIVLNNGTIEDLLYKSTVHHDLQTVLSI